jgi:hypothetical protein
MNSHSERITRRGLRLKSVEKMRDARAKIQGIAEAVDRSTAGTAKPSSQFVKMTEKMVSGKKKVLAA